MKKCPFCAEEIKKDAVFCKHCKKDIPKEKTWTQKMTEEAEKAKITENRYIATLSEEDKKKYFEKKKKNEQTTGVVVSLLILIIMGFFVSKTVGLGLIALIVLYFLGKYLFKKHKEQNFKIRISRTVSKYKANKRRYNIVIASVLIVSLTASGIFITNYLQKEHEKELEAQKQEMITNYPVPKIEILSSKDPQGKADKYLLRLNATDAESLTISYGDTGKVEKTLSGGTKQDIIEQEIPLLHTETDISIDAKNTYKTSHESILIKRDKNSQELAKEEEDKKNEQIESIELQIALCESMISDKEEYIRTSDPPYDEYQRLNNEWLAKGNFNLDKELFFRNRWREDISQLKRDLSSLKYELRTIK